MADERSGPGESGESFLAGFGVPFLQKKKVPRKSIAKILQKKALAMRFETLCLHSISRHRPAEAWHMAPHQHAHCEMVVVAHGRQETEIAGRRYVAEMGDALFYPPKILHEEWSARRDRLESIFFSFAWPDCPPDLHHHLRDPKGRMLALAGWLLAERDAHSPGAAATRGALLSAIMALYAQGVGGGEDPLVTATRRYIRAHLAEPLTLEALAVRAGLSKFHFLRRYRTLTGRTPLDDVRALRVDRARELILTTDLPLKTVAPLTGLANEQHLSRLFRRQLGITPGSLRGS